MGAMNRGLNLPQIQRIMHEFEKESATMDMKEEMMSDAVDDVMDEGLEDEEEEGDKILKQVLDEIGVDLSQQVYSLHRLLSTSVLKGASAAHRCTHRSCCIITAYRGSTTGGSRGRRALRRPWWRRKWERRRYVRRRCPTSTFGCLAERVDVPSTDGQ